MIMPKSLPLALLGLSLALALAANQATAVDLYNPLLSDGSLLRLTEIAYKPIEVRCSLFVQALREILGVSYHKASGEQLIAHGLQIVARKGNDQHHVLKELERCQLARGKDFLRDNLDSSQLVSALKDKAKRKLGLDGAKYYGDHLGEGLAGNLDHLHRKAHHQVGLPTHEAGHHLKQHGEHAIGGHYEEKRHLERVLDSKLIDLHAKAREIEALRHEVHELRQVASGKAYEVTARIVDRAQYEALRLDHEVALKREHHLRRVVHELERELAELRYRHSAVNHHGHHYGGHHAVGLSVAHGEGKHIYDPIEQAIVLSHHLAHHEHESTSSRCFRYYLLFSFPEAISKKTIKTVAKLPIKLNSLDLFFELINPHHVSNLLRTSHRLAESHEESVRRIGHEMRHCLEEAEHYVSRHHKVHFNDIGVHLAPGVFEQHGHINTVHGPVEFETSHHHHSGPSHGSAGATSTSTSSTTSASGSAAAAAAATSAGASAGAGSASAASSASASAGGATILSPLSPLH